MHYRTARKLQWTAGWISLAALACAALGLVAAIAARAEASAPVDAIPQDVRHKPELTGEQIYQKVLDNRFASYEQIFEMHSGDRGGNIQDTVMQLKYLSFRETSERILSKTIMKYDAPQDVRHLGYLVINKVDGSEDQFVYRPSSRRVRRINLRGEAIFGTDFAFEDLIPQELENATYARKNDDVVSELPVYVVEVTPVEEQDSDYSKFHVYVDRDRFVPLRVHYWDTDDLKIKELNADPASIEQFEDEEGGELKQIWVAKEQKIVHLKLESWTKLEVTKLDPSVKLKEKHFSQRELTQSH